MMKDQLFAFKAKSLIEIDSAHCSKFSVIRASILKELVNDDIFVKTLSTSTSIALGSDKTSVWWGRTFLEMHFNGVDASGDH